VIEKKKSEEDLIGDLEGLKNEILDLCSLKVTEGEWGKTTKGRQKGRKGDTITIDSRKAWRLMAEECLKKKRLGKILYTDLVVQRKKEPAFKMVVKTRSMTPEIRPGDEIRCDPAAEVNDGNTALIRIGGRELLRRVFWGDGIVRLVSPNPKFETIVFTTRTAFKAIRVTDIYLQAYAVKPED